MPGEVRSFVNAFYPVDILPGLSRVHIRISVDAIVSVVEKCMQKLCSTAASIALIKDAISVGKKNPTRSQI